MDKNFRCRQSAGLLTSVPHSCFTHITHKTKSSASLIELYYASVDRATLAVKREQSLSLQAVLLKPVTSSIHRETFYFHRREDLSGVLYSRLVRRKISVEAALSPTGSNLAGLNFSTRIMVMVQP